MNENEISKKEQRQETANKVADTALRGAATYFGGAAGNQAYNKISNTKIGQAAINSAGKSLNHGPFAKAGLDMAKPIVDKAKTAIDNSINAASGNGISNQSNSFNSLANNKSNHDNDTNEQNKDPKIDSVKKIKKVKLYATVAAIVAAAFAFLFLIAIIVSIFMAPFQFVEDLKNNVSTNFEKLGNFLTLGGWCTDDECDEKEKENFYNEINKVYDNYYQDKKVALKTGLIISTLTYSNPFVSGNDVIDIDDIDNYSSNLSDFKKAKKQIDKLASEMVEKATIYYLQDEESKKMLIAQKIESEDEVQSGYCVYKYKKNIYSTLCDEFDGQIDYDVVEQTSYQINVEKYKKYLYEEFIPKYYFNNKIDGVDLDPIINEIVSRADFFDYINNIQVETTNYQTNNVLVDLSDSSGNISLEKLTIDEYLQGVVYFYSDSSYNLEYLKAVAIAARSYLYGINGATKSNSPSRFSIKNTSDFQLYCSIKQGCHYDGTATLMSGSDANGNYVKQPLRDEYAIQKINSAINETRNSVIYNSDNVVKANICLESCDSLNNNMDMQKAISLVNNENYTYIDLITTFYGGEIAKIAESAYHYPLDVSRNYISSAYGWRIHPVQKICKHHNGTDIPADANSNIYAIADGVVVTNVTDSSYGNYTVIGHGMYDSNTKTYEYYSLYAHQIRLSSLIRVGDYVKAGQTIGNVGSTGTSTGNHLHIEIYSYSNGTKLRKDPTSYFPNISFTGVIGPRYDNLQQCNAANR